MDEKTQRTKLALKLYGASGDKNYSQILDLVKASVDVQATDDDKQTLLHWAAAYGHRDVCALLIQQKAQIDAPSNDGYTPLHDAALWDKTEVIKLLLEQGADIYARDDRGDTPLHKASREKNTEVMQSLVGHGANIWAEDKNRLVPLDFDEKRCVESIRLHWEPVLWKIQFGDYSAIHTPQDLYHLASVMKPANPKDIPHPKEFIRLLFQQYLPHEPKFDAMYEEIFSQPRPLEQNLQSTREAAKGSKGVVL